MRTPKTANPLRKGWTTGACATAAARAAYEALITGAFPDPVTIRLPRGRRADFPLARATRTRERATAGVIKDAGDDPDVTHGALVLATVEPGEPGTGITFAAGEGVGVVTLPGLGLPVGEPAINPKPREMMQAAIAEVALEYDGPRDLRVTIAVPGGEKLAERTTSARLGIRGGISILGTTGIVIPYSCASWIHSIYRGIDVAREAGLAHVAGATGRSSERAVQRLYDLPEIALIDMGDFVGGMLKYLRRHPIPRLTVAGGFGKLSKLAAGHLDLHSDRSRIDPDHLGNLLAGAGADPRVVARARAATSAGAILELARDTPVSLPDLVARGAREVALAALGGG
ncbi:MAG: cobalt-precorrin-5B (C(1))-methyltransferase, partial [Alphaproteobacteria bacterium]